MSVEQKEARAEEGRADRRTYSITATEDALGERRREWRSCAERRLRVVEVDILARRFLWKMKGGNGALSIQDGAGDWILRYSAFLEHPVKLFQSKSQH